MREEGIHSRSKTNRRRSQSEEPEFLIQDEIFIINKHKLKSPIEDDFEYEILIDGSDTYSDGRHLDGYREGDDESDKYF